MIKMEKHKFDIKTFEPNPNSRGNTIVSAANSTSTLALVTRECPVSYTSTTVICGQEAHNDCCWCDGNADLKKISLASKASPILHHVRLQIHQNTKCAKSTRFCLPLKLLKSWLFILFFVTFWDMTFDGVLIFSLLYYEKKQCWILLLLQNSLKNK